MAEHSHADRVVPDLEVRMVVLGFGEVRKAVDEFDGLGEVFGQDTDFESSFDDRPAGQLLLGFC